VSNPRQKPSEAPALDADTLPTTSVPPSATRNVAKPSGNDPARPNTSDDATLAPDNAPDSQPVVTKYVDDPTLKGDPNDEAASEAGDHALPLDLEEVSSANDTDAPDPARERFRVRMADRTLFPRLVGHLRFPWDPTNRVTREAAEDIAQDALIRALRCKTLPDENRPLYSWLRRFANFQRLRYRTAEGKRTSREELVPDFETHAVEPEQGDDQAEAKARVAREVAAESVHNAQAYGLMEAQAENDQTLHVVASQQGLKPATAQKQVERYKLDVRKRWARYSAMVVAVGAMILLFIHFQHDDDVVTNHVPSAAEIREEALTACAKGQYKACLRDLDWAKEQDPRGDRDPAIVEARAKAKAALGQAGGQAP